MTEDIRPPTACTSNRYSIQLPTPPFTSQNCLLEIVNFSSIPPHFYLPNV